MVLPAQSPPGPAAGATTTDITTWASRFAHLHIDLGTGDGRFVMHLARRQPELGVIGIDTCLDHLHGSPRRLPANVRLVQTDARDAWIGEGPRATSVSINFPYGSLLRGLVDADLGLLDRLDDLLGPQGRLQIRVNERALTGTDLDPNGAEHAILHGFQQLHALRAWCRPLSQDELRAFPSTWSKRIGFGRPTTAFLIVARRRSV